jgi:hypothetical protein
VGYAAKTPSGFREEKLGAAAHNDRRLDPRLFKR